MLKKNKFIVIYSLPRTGTHLSLNTITKNFNLGSDYKVINLDKIHDITDLFITSDKLIILKTHNYNNLLSLLEIQKDNVYIITPNTPYNQGCISYLNYMSVFCKDIENKSKQLEIVNERYIKFIQFHKNYNYLDNLYNTIKIHRKSYENYESYIKIIYLLSKFLDLKILDKDNIIFYDDKKFLIRKSREELGSILVLKNYDLKIYDETLANINKLNEKDNIQILNNLGIH